MTTYLGKSCSFGLPQVPFVNCGQFMYLVISLLVLRAGCGIWLYQFLIIAYLFTLQQTHRVGTISSNNLGGYLNRFVMAKTLGLGSTAVHKHRPNVVRSAWMTSTHQCTKTANIHIKIQYRDETRRVVNSKTNTEALEQKKPNSWTPVVLNEDRQIRLDFRRLILQRK